MKRTAGSLAIFALATFSVCAALTDGKTKTPDVSKLVPPSNMPGLTYEKDIKPIVEASCFKCHGVEKPKGRFRLDSRDTMIKGGESEQAAIVPGQSAKSPLIWYVSDLVEEMEMPPLDKRDKNTPLTKEQIAILRAWIDQGAK